MTETDPYDLKRFVAAQEPVFASALAELRAGRKRTHWMWFVFPQLRGLGHSPTATYYGIASLDEARAYLAHPLLGPRLELCTNAVCGIEGRTLHEIFGSPDDMKFHSSVTLFSLIEPRDAVFERALDKYFNGELDERTIAILGVAQ